MAVTVEDAHVRTLHILPVTLAVFLAEASTNALEANALHIDIGSQVDDHVACHFTIVHSIGESLQLFAIADETCTAYLADVVLILVISTLGLALSVGVADVATSRAVAVHRANSIDHQVVGKRYGIVVATQCLTPSIAGAALVKAVAEFARLHGINADNLGSTLREVGDVIGIEAVHHAGDVAGKHGGVATQTQQRCRHIAVLDEGFYATVGIADDSGTTLAVGSIHGAHEGTVGEGRALVANSEETAVGSIAGIRTRDVHSHDDVFISTSAAADEAQTADEALCALNSTVDNEVANGGVADHLEECHTVVTDVVVDGDLMTLTVEDALERTALVALVGRESIATDHHVLLGELAEVDVGAQASVHLLMSLVHQSGKPVQVGSCGEGVEAIGERQVVQIDITAARADTINKGVRVAVRLVLVGVHLIATLRGAVAVQVANSIDDAVRRERNGEGINAEGLEPHDVFALATVQLISHATHRQVVLVLADVSTLIAIGVVVVRALAVTVAPHGVATIHTDDVTGVVAIGDHTTVVAHPAAKGCSLTTTGDAASVEAVQQTDAASAVHAHATDTSCILFLCTHATFVTAVLECHRAASVGTTGDGSDEALTRYRAAIVDDHVLNRSTIVQDTEEAYILLLRQVDDHVTDEVLLSVEGSTEGTARCSNWLVVHTRHIDVLGEHGANGTIATGHNV